MVEHFFIYNNNFFRATVPVIGIENRSLMYGDGLFETMRMHHAKLINESLHFERFFAGIYLLKLPLSETFTEAFFKKQIQELLLENKIKNNARVRLMAFRKEEQSMNEKNGTFNYIIEAWPMKETIILNETGLEIDIFKDVKRSCDRFSNIKSNNYLASVMAQIFAQENNLDECLLVNAFDRVCESAIANVFIVKNDVIYTPPLSEGCVAGIVRKWLIENLPFSEFKIQQKQLLREDVYEADEIFLTNSIKPVRWVQAFQGKVYDKTMSLRIARYVHKHMNGN